MPVEFFLDTNILVYTFDDTAPDKQLKAQALVERALEHKTGVISYQVTQEFINVATRKFTPPLSTAQTLRYLHEVLEPLCGVFSGNELYRKAIGIQERWRYSFYDSLIIASALSAGCKTLYSEDLQASQSIESLTIVDPFR